MPKLLTPQIETPSRELINNYYSPLTTNFPLIPKTVNTERRRGKPKYAK